MESTPCSRSLRTVFDRMAYALMQSSRKSQLLPADEAVGKHISHKREFPTAREFRPPWQPLRPQFGKCSRRVNASEWLASRRPAPPAKLAQRLESALSEFLSAPDVTPSDAFAVAAAGILRRLMRAESRPSSRRDEAIALPAADALVTY